MISEIMTVVVVLVLIPLSLILVSVVFLVGLAALALGTSREQDGRTTSRR
ncbi:hypothetical protein [Streptosporangium sp. H16]